MADRQFDIVVFGATGFTGALTAEYLAKHAPRSTRWALAGRNAEKLAAVGERLGRDDLPVLHADVEDANSVNELARSTRVVITTVGPYIKYGEPLVAACAEAGTDYLDLTGEPEFVDLMYVRHHARAAESGARLIHACGFDSIPHDLGTYFTVQQLPEDVPIEVEGFVRVGGDFSGGTFASAVTAFSRVREMRSAAAERRKREPTPDGRRVRAGRPRPRYERSIGAWALPAPTIDPQIILRSARALDRYGPDFRYGHYFAIKRLPVAVGAVGGLTALFAASQIPPARKWLLSRRPSGAGPSPEQRAEHWFNVRFVGRGGGDEVTTEVSGGDPGYDETAKMLAESALSLAHDDLPATAGQVTTAIAMGDSLISRLTRAGMRFEVVDG